MKWFSNGRKQKCKDILKTELDLYYKNNPPEKIIHNTNSPYDLIFGIPETPVSREDELWILEPQCSMDYLHKDRRKKL